MRHWQPLFRWLPKGIVLTSAQTLLRLIFYKPKSLGRAKHVVHSLTRQLWWVPWAQHHKTRMLLSVYSISWHTLANLTASSPNKHPPGCCSNISSELQKELVKQTILVCTHDRKYSENTNKEEKRAFDSSITGIHLLYFQSLYFPFILQIEFPCSRPSPFHTLSFPSWVHVDSSTVKI